MTDYKIPLIRRILSDSAYEWMLNHLHHRLMYVKKQIDSQHFMWMPRYGYTKKQMDEASKRANEIITKIKWK